MIKVLIADDHRLFIDGLKAMLEGTAEIKVVGEAMNGQEVFAFRAQQTVDIVIMDIQLESKTGGKADFARRR